MNKTSPSQGLGMYCPSYGICRRGLRRYTHANVVHATRVIYDRHVCSCIASGAEDSTPFCALVMQLI